MGHGESLGTYDCMAIALNILQVLQETNTIKIRASPSPQPSPFVGDLAINREAIEIVWHMMRCRCSLEKQLWIALTLACS